MWNIRLLYSVVATKPNCFPRWSFSHQFTWLTCMVWRIRLQKTPPETRLSVSSHILFAVMPFSCLHRIGRIRVLPFFIACVLPYLYTYLLIHTWSYGDELHMYAAQCRLWKSWLMNPINWTYTMFMQCKIKAPSKLSQDSVGKLYARYVHRSVWLILSQLNWKWSLFFRQHNNRRRWRKRRDQSRKNIRCGIAYPWECQKP